MSEKITTPMIRDLLRKRYAGLQWFLAFEVREAAGYQKATHRTADAIAMNVWPSQGHVIHGFEIKVSRADWRKELEDPDKAAAMQALCDYWWLVAPAKVAELSEIPPTWGFMQAAATRLNIVRDAPLLGPLGTRPMDRSFVAMLVRNRSAEDPEVKEALEKIRRQHEKELERRVEHRVSMDEAEYRRLKEWREAFLRALGEDGRATVLNAIDSRTPEQAAERLRRAWRLVKLLETRDIAILERSAEDVLKAVRAFTAETDGPRETAAQ